MEPVGQAGWAPWTLIEGVEALGTARSGSSLTLCIHWVKFLGPGRCGVRAMPVARTCSTGRDLSSCPGPALRRPALGECCAVTIPRFLVMLNEGHIFILLWDCKSHSQSCTWKPLGLWRKGCQGGLCSHRAGRAGTLRAKGAGLGMVARCSKWQHWMLS